MHIVAACNNNTISIGVCLLSIHCTYYLYYLCYVVFLSFLFILILILCIFYLEYIFYYFYYFFITMTVLIAAGGLIRFLAFLALFIVDYGDRCLFYLIKKNLLLQSIKLKCTPGGVKNTMLLSNR